MDFKAAINLVVSAAVAALASAGAVIFGAGADMNSRATWTAAFSTFVVSFIQHLRNNPLK